MSKIKKSSTRCDWVDFVQTAIGRAAAVEPEVLCCPRVADAGTTARIPPPKKDPTSLHKLVLR